MSQPGSNSCRRTSVVWWSWPGLNRRPRECHSRALPTAPQPHASLMSHVHRNGKTAPVTHVTLQSSMAGFWQSRKGWEEAEPHASFLLAERAENTCSLDARREGRMSSRLGGESSEYLKGAGKKDRGTTPQNPS